MENMGLEGTYDKVQDNSYKEIWDVAIGLNKVDNLLPSKYLLEISKQSYEIGKSTDDIEKALNKYYSTLNTDDEVIANERECDIVSTRIVKILGDKSFNFSPIYLKTIHRILFTDVFKYPLNNYIGKFREYNITKKESVLKNESVTYGDYNGLLDYLKYDFDVEAEINYAKLTVEEQVKRIAKFTSAIWQVHPFCEGNTRTVAVFMIKYLNFLGYEVNNNLFKEHSKYFRDALVLSNYTNIKLGYKASYKYLESFYYKLISEQEIELEIVN
ncbi:Fic family protein [uncultured Clostridium sp.]|uniref:Fic family protein n=1 Tax=uncultured Clostridium sp. TaxID=59620 RepID=UPI0026071CBA|nr:Fic family protein [uncultured Clostridium sp.]